MPLRWRLAASLFALTFLSTTIVGARFEFDFANGFRPFTTEGDLDPWLWIWRNPGELHRGLTFSLALLAILLAHELGHYVACRRHHVEATLPYFLPAPTPFGTFGAFIRIRSAFFNRKELFDVGVAGPIAGFLLTLPILWHGMSTSRVLAGPLLTSAPQPFLILGWPLLSQLAASLIFPGTPLSHIVLSPLAIAAWIGMFVTMLNLLPAAQLDGGHILYAVAPGVHRYISWLAVVALAVCGRFFWTGWYLWAGFILLMRVRHPFVPSHPGLGRVRSIVALLALAIMAAVFALVPVITP